jgi:hypothetical protein
LPELRQRRVQLTLQDLAELSDHRGMRVDRQSFLEGPKLEFGEATGEDLEALIVEALAEFDSDKAGFIIPELVSRFATERQFYELIHTAIALVFPKADEPIDREALTALQIKVLTSALSNDAIWLYDLHLLAELLPSRGLPANRKAMAAFLETEQAK